MDVIAVLGAFPEGRGRARCAMCASAGRVKHGLARMQDSLDVGHYGQSSVERRRKEIPGS